MDLSLRQKTICMLRGNLFIYELFIKSINHALERPVFAGEYWIFEVTFM